MKGFIEVTYLGGTKVLINIKHIRKVSGDKIFFDNNIHGYVKESYEQIKELIKQAQ